MVRAAPDDFLAPAESGPGAAGTAFAPGDLDAQVPAADPARPPEPGVDRSPGCAERGRALGHQVLEEPLDPGGHPVLDPVYRVVGRGRQGLDPVVGEDGV